MPHHKSAAKRVITNELSRQRNVALRSRMRASIKAVRDAEDRAAAEGALRRAVSVLDRSVAKGVITRSAANRYKSRLAHFTHKLAATS